MFCSTCGNKLLETAKFCGGCGKNVVPVSIHRQEASGQEKEEVEKESGIVSNSDSPKVTIKCGNCGFVGEGEPARRMIFKILAWSVVLFAPLITILYFVATHKYRCPKCKSTFLGVKNEQGVFVGQKGGGSRWAVIIVVVLVGIAIIGILASIVLASLNSARIKARDARRIADMNQIRSGLERYYDAYSNYPTSLDQLAPKYISEVPTDPSNRATYNYSNCGEGATYHLGASLEEEKHRALAEDDDIDSMCSSDTISGSDESKCSDTDSGSYCYDVTHIE